MLSQIVPLLVLTAKPFFGALGHFMKMKSFHGVYAEGEFVLVIFVAFEFFLSFFRDKRQETIVINGEKNLVLF